MASEVGVEEWGCQDFHPAYLVGMAGVEVLVEGMVEGELRR